MKQILIALCGGMLILNACAQTEIVTPVVITQESTATPSLVPTSTNTSLPTATPTASITLLPTIPTFTPTFDALTIVTVTPTTKADCPEIDSAIGVEDYLPGKLEYPSSNTTEKILDFLNEGGDGQALIARLKQIYPMGGDYRGGFDFYDVTGDQSPEFLYVEINYEGKLLVFSCKNGNYELLAKLPEKDSFLEYTMQVVNLNRNGIPEIIVMGTNGASFPQSRIYLYAWNGHNFTILLETGISPLRQMETRDINGDGVKEVLLIGDNPTCVSCSNFIPQRQRTGTYGWNGKEFVEISREFEPPEYRFQALQDADSALVIGNYSKAMQLYDETISNNALDWWSPERFTYEQHVGNPVIMFIETPSSIPTEDLTEHSRLAAYAFYRVMLIYLVQGNEEAAETVYRTLQESLGSDPYAQPYVEMATAFWNAYQSTHKMYDGCAAAIQYAAEHSEILVPLGSDYHGWQSHTYVPADVCPFR